MEQRVVKTLDEKIAAFDARIAERMAVETAEEAARNAAKVVELQAGYLQRTGRKELRP